MSLEDKWREVLGASAGEFKKYELQLSDLAKSFDVTPEVRQALKEFESSLGIGKTLGAFRPLTEYERALEALKPSAEMSKILAPHIAAQRELQGLVDSYLMPHTTDSVSQTLRDFFSENLVARDRIGLFAESVISPLGRSVEDLIAPALNIPKFDMAGIYGASMGSMFAGISALKLDFFSPSALGVEPLSDVIARLKSEIDGVDSELARLNVATRHTSYIEERVGVSDSIVDSVVHHEFPQKEQAIKDLSDYRVYLAAILLYLLVFMEYYNTLSDFRRNIEADFEAVSSIFEAKEVVRRVDSPELLTHWRFINGADVHLRLEPNKKSDVLLKLQNGKLVEKLEADVEASRSWLYVRVKVGDEYIDGWVFRRYTTAFHR